MEESKIQSYIIRKAKEKGYLAIKIGQANINGLPDILLLNQPGSEHDTMKKYLSLNLWVEVKRKDGKLSRLQEHRIKQLAQNYNQIVHVVYGMDHAKKFIDLL